jgi:hypothetical protein
MESQMTEMLRIVRNGRAQLQINQPPQPTVPKPMPGKGNLDRKLP